MEFINGISIIGSGNVAWHLTHLFVRNKVQINALVSRNEKSAANIAQPLKLPFSSDINIIPENTDLILICVADGAIDTVAEMLAGKNIPVAHTAGSVSLEVLSKYHKNAGVFYPFQTFTRDIPLSDSEFPICIEATNSELSALLFKLANYISKKIISLNSEERKHLHLSGILVNNFSNYLYAKAFDYLESKKIESELLLPLIQQTVKKIGYDHPEKLQTGPAARGAKQVIEKHLIMLAGNKELEEIYKLMSNKILQFYNNKNE